MNEHHLIRKLAKSVEMQNLFIAVKEIHSLSLFKNKTELSSLQQAFLSYLYFYNEIYKDIASNLIKDIILESEYYEDSYTYWKRKNSGRNPKDKPDRPKDFHLVFSKRTK